MQKAIEQSVQGTTVVIDETSKNPSEFIRPDFSLLASSSNLPLHSVFLSFESRLILDNLHDDGKHTSTALLVSVMSETPAT